MQFMYPAFLFALASLAIPVVVHLFNFRRYQKVQFSNVQFLKELQEQQASRRNIKERLILVSRLLALFFLVLAFARPFIPRGNADGAGQQQAISIFVDNSYSMQTLNREGSLLDQARQQARQIAAAYGINDRFQLLTQDFEGKHQRLLSRDEFNDAVDAIQISAQSRTLQQILNRQQSLLKDARNMQKSVYVLSDFQKNMAGGDSLKTDEQIPVNLIKLKAGSLPNVAVDSVWLLSAVHRPGGTERLAVRLHNYSEKEAAGIPLKLLVNGSQKALGSFAIPARGVTIDTLDFSGLQAGWQRGEIQLQDNPVTFDNRFYFTFNVRQQLPVLLIDGGMANPYLQAVFSTDRFFSITRTSEGNVDYAGLNEFPLVVISDIISVSSGLAGQLAAYVKGGGTLLVFPAADAETASYKAMLQPLGAAWPQDMVTQEIKVSGLNMQNRLFKDVFDTAPQNPDMPVIKKYYRLNSTGSAEPILQLPGNSTFWGGYASGKGRLYVSAVPLNNDYSNLQRHGLFVPIMFRIALLSDRDVPLFYTLGGNEGIETVPLTSTEKEILSLNKGDQHIIPEVRPQAGGTLLYLPDQLQQTGIYQLKKQDSTIAVMAFNDNRLESDLRYLSSGDLEKMMPGNGSKVISNRQVLSNVGNEINNGIQLWKLCIILALIFLAAEIVLIRYYKTDRRLIQNQV